MIPAQGPRDYYRRLLADNGRVEVRHHDGRRWQSYWHGDEEGLLGRLRACYRVGDLYTSLNAPKLGMPGDGGPIKNDDVAWITRLPFDFDPVRPKDTPATLDMLEDALDRRGAFLGLLGAFSWGIPLLAMSGNGYHAQFRARLPNNPETRAMLDEIYLGLKPELSDDVVTFDVSVRNAGRIFRAYGSINRKGGGDRRSTVWIPPRWQQLGQADVERAASYYARKRPQVVDRKPGPAITGKGDYTTLAIMPWLETNGLYLYRAGPSKHAIKCPWEDEHTTTTSRSSTVVFENPGKWPAFHCSHSHCAGRNIRDLMALLGDADRFCFYEYGEEHA